MFNDNAEKDEVLYTRYLAAGEESCLRALLQRHREELTFFLFGIIHNAEDAEELMMDAFAVAASGTARFSGKSSFKTWLFAIGRNLALKELRRRRFRFIPIDDNMVSTSGCPETEFLTQERNTRLYEAMSNINPEYRQALHLAYFCGMSTDEIAVVLKKNTKQVYNLVSRGKVALREELERMGYSRDTVLN